jgi:CheY-like chemotaxis protein
MATILVVDDRAPNRELLVTLLGYKGHRLLEAADGAEALAIVRTERPDLVITDIPMPTMDGYEFVRELRADPEIAATPWARPVIPMMPLIGVRISWLMLARNSLLARFAASAVRFASRSCISKVVEVDAFDRRAGAVVAPDAGPRDAHGPSGDLRDPPQRRPQVVAVELVAARQRDQRVALPVVARIGAAQLLLGALAFGDVARVHHDAPYVGIVEQIAADGFDVAPGTVAVPRSRFTVLTAATSTHTTSAARSTSASPCLASRSARDAASRARIAAAEAARTAYTPESAALARSATLRVANAPRTIHNVPRRRAISGRSTPLESHAPELLRRFCMDRSSAGRGRRQASPMDRESSCHAKPRVRRVASGAASPGRHRLGETTGIAMRVTPPGTMRATAHDAGLRSTRRRVDRAGPHRPAA